MTRPNRESSLALTVLMPTATGPAITSDYYAQSLPDTIARNFSPSASSIGFIVTAMQLGCAAGLLFLVPLDNVFERHRSVVLMTLLAAGGMLITTSSQSLAMTILDTALTGLFSIVAQILVPLVAALASLGKRGRVVGIVTNDLLLGILLARTIVRLLANLGGWHTVLRTASILMVLMALTLWCGLPQMKSKTRFNYPQLLSSVFSMFISNKILHAHALLGCLTFANFNIPWTSTAFSLATPPFSCSGSIADLFELVGVAGALGTRPAGSSADEDKLHYTTTFNLLLLLLSWLVIWLGHTSVLVLIVGILVLDLTVQGVHITNQTVIYRIHPDTRDRLTAGYMTSYFIGGTASSLIPASVWQHGDWVGICLADATVALVNLLVWWRSFHRQRAVN